MNYLIFICMATGSVLADLSAPTQALPTIMAALRDQRDDGSVTTAAPSAEESLATHPFAYYSFGGEGDGTSTCTLLQKELHFRRTAYGHIPIFLRGPDIIPKGDLYGYFFRELLEDM
jgi:hypothetical protein